MLSEISLERENVQEWWTHNANIIRNCAKEVLGETSGKVGNRKRPGGGIMR